MRKLLFLFTIFACMACSDKHPDIILPPIISDSMVLQQKAHANIWGWSEPGVIMHVETGWGANVKVRTNIDGRWNVSVNTPEYGGPYTITVRAKKTIRLIEDVMIGEVWLCSGQSNMEMPLRGWPPKDLVDNSDEEISKAKYPQIRMFTVEKQMSLSPGDFCEGEWKVCSPESAPDFSATAYFFGVKLFKETGMPVGLIHSSWSGTPAEAWTPSRYLEDVAGFEEFSEEFEQRQDNKETYKEFLTGLKSRPKKDLANSGLHDELGGDAVYAAKEYDFSHWKTMKIPGRWEEKGLPGFDGIVWFKKEFELPDLYPESFELYLGAIDDMDATYFNGVLIGKHDTSGVWNKERRYAIPSEILKVGKNVISVKVTDTGGRGGILGDNEGPAVYKGANKVVDLSGNWNYMPVAYVFKNKVYLFEDGNKSFNALPKLKYPLNQNAPTVLYNAMIAPLLPYNIKGAIWYQGESNVWRPEQYRTLFPAMIKSWRAGWGQRDFPFFYVQIAPYNYGQGAANKVAELRQAQLETMSENNVGMVVTMDIGNPGNIHPGNKKEVGNRLALWALAKTYGREDIVCSGPLFSGISFRNGDAILEFEYAENGLKLNEGALSFFEVAGKDEVYYPAEYEITGKKIRLTSDAVPKIKFVRYAWGDDVEPNLFNTEGLPASPFRVKKQSPF